MTSFLPSNWEIDCSYSICGEQNNPVAKMSLSQKNLQHCYFLTTGLFCSPQVSYRSLGYVLGRLRDRMICYMQDESVWCRMYSTARYWQ